MKKVHVFTIVILSISIAILIDWLYSGEIKLELFKKLTIVVSAVGIAIFIFEKYIWQLPFLQGWFVFRPNISGRWKVEICPLVIDPATDKKGRKRKYFFDIKQTYTDINIRMIDGPESKGESLTAKFVKSNDGEYILFATYLNEPNISIRDRSEIHFGTMKLAVIYTNTSMSLEGHYWTDRLTRGEVKAKKLL